MAAHPPVETCFFCGEIHHGLCADLKPEKPAKPARKPRAAKTPPPQGSLPEAVASEPSSVGSGPVAGVDVDFEHAEEVGRRLIDMSERWASQAAKRSDLDVALDVLAPILHDTELQKYSRTQPARPSSRAAEWRNVYREYRPA